MSGFALRKNGARESLCRPGLGRGAGGAEAVRGVESKREKKAWPLEAVSPGAIFVFVFFRAGLCNTEANR
jgi:hypothetical protein